MFVPPSGPGRPAPAAAEAWQAATASCRTIETYSALVALSGRAPRFPTLTVTVAFSSKGDAYLQAQHSGTPLFLLAGTRTRASLWLRDDNRLVTEPLEDIVDALVGARLGAEDLLAFLSGCPLRAPAVTEASQIGDLLAISTTDGRAYLDRVGTTYRVRAAETKGLVLDYGKPAAGWPRDLTIATSDRRVHLRFRPEQVETNAVLPVAMFAMPAAANQASPMTLEELRAAGPLRR